MIVDPKKLLDELHVDDTPEEEATVTSLLESSKAIVDEAIQDKENPGLKDDPLYSLAIKTLATQLYFDRTLSAGKAPAVRTFIAHLQFKYGGDNSGT